MIYKRNHRFPVTVGERLAVTLRLLATADSQKTVAFSFPLGHATVNKIFHETCEILWEVLKNNFLKFSSTEKWKEIATDFENYWNYPLCCGAIDGKHAVIRAPPTSGSDFHNYKGTHSVVLLIVVDARYNFTVIDVGVYGRESDSGLFSCSKFERMMSERHLNIPEPIFLPNTAVVVPHVFVGEEGFALKPNLM